MLLRASVSARGSTDLLLPVEVDEVCVVAVVKLEWPVRPRTIVPIHAQPTCMSCVEVCVNLPLPVAKATGSHQGMVAAVMWQQSRALHRKYVALVESI